MMCMIDDSDEPEFHVADDVVARRDHKCGECRRVIAKGETYESSRGKWNGDFDSHKTCAHCCAAREWLTMECSGFCYGAVREDLHEHFDYGPTMELGRLLVGMRRKWKRFGGDNMPIPMVARRQKRGIKDESR